MTGATIDRATTAAGPSRRASGAMGSYEGMKKLLARTLAGPGPGSGPGIKAAGTEVDESMPRDEPPGFSPSVRKAPAFVEVSARLVASLKRDYGRGVATDQGRRIGDLPEVDAWIESLQPGKVRPRGIGR